MESLWGLMKPISADMLHEVADGEEIQVGNQAFKALFTPGHASHHIAWQWGKTIFTGDVAGVRIGEGPVVPPVLRQISFLKLGNDSIARIRAAQPEALYLTHFGKVEAVGVHLDQLESILNDWAQWMKGPFEGGEIPVTPEFEAYTDQQLREAGVDQRTGVAQYGAALHYMSVAGLLRYWNKRDDLGSVLAWAHCS